MSPRDEPARADARIEFVDLARLHAPLRDDLLAAAARVIDDGGYVLGNEVARFEADFARTVGAAHAVGCNSGTDALVLALAALGVGPGDLVVCPAFSFFASASAIARVGAVPVFADVDPIDANLDPASAADACEIVGDVRALVVADLYGRSAPMGDLLALANGLDAFVVEDAAQAIGALDAQALPAGSRADVGCFSLYPTKNLGALGDGGVVVTSDADLAARLRSLRSHGIGDDGRHADLGMNSRLDALQAALLSVKLPYLEKWTEARRSHAAGYRDRFEAALGDPLEVGLQLPRPDSGSERQVAHQYVVHVPAEQRDPLRRHLDGRGIASAVYYDTTLHHEPAFARVAATPVPLPHAERAAKTGLALPVHPDLSPSDLDRVVDAVCGFFSAR